MRLSHVGIIVKDIEEGIKHHEKLFGMSQIGPIVEDHNQKVKVVLVAQSDDDPVKIELIQPMTPDSPVSQLLKKRQSLYHLCFEVDDIEKAKKQARANGAITVSQPTPAELFDGRDICFLFTPDHYLIELVQSKS